MDQEYKDIAPGDMIITKSNGPEYELVPDAEMLQVHVSRVQTMLGDNYDRTAKEEKLVIGVTLDEDIPGKGQVYTGWFTKSLNEKSNLTKLVAAVYGEIPASFDPTDLVGKMLRVTLKNKDKDGSTRQYLDGFFKAAKGQSIPEDELVSGEDLDKAIDEAFQPVTD